MMSYTRRDVIMNEGDSSGSPADELKSKLQRVEEIEFSLKRLRGLLDIANRCDLNKDEELKGVLSGYKTAYQSLSKGDLTNAHLQQFDAYHDLIKVLNSTRGSGKHFYQRFSVSWITFMARVYGIYSISLSILFAIVFSILLIKTMDQHFSLYGVPLWAALFAGLGCCIQIILGVVSDVRANGILSEEKHLLYVPLPFVALIFGYIAYIFIDLGMMTLGAGQGSQSASITAANVSLIKVSGATAFELTSNVSGNYAFSAGNVANLTATGVNSFSSNIGNQARIIACFIAGYATDDFIKNLKNVSNKI